MRPIITWTMLLIIATGSNPRLNESTGIVIQNQSEKLSVSCDLIDNWERARSFTMQYLEAMPEEHYSFQSTPEILSFAHEFLHVACVNYRYMSMLAGGYDCSNYDDVYNNPSLQSKESVIDFVMASYDAMIYRLTQESDLSEPTYYYQWS